MDDQDYKNEMRRYIEVVKKMAFEAPLEQALDDLKTLTQATQQITDRIDMRVRKSLNPTDKGKKGAVSKAKGKVKRKGIKPMTMTAPTKPKQQNPLPTTKTPTSSAVSQADYNRVKQDSSQSLQPIQPIKPIGNVT